MADTDKFLDLDAALNEEAEAAEPLQVRLYGQLWNLPGTPPAAVTLRLSLWFENGLIVDGKPTSEVTGAALTLLLADMVPKDVLDQWFAKGLGTDQLFILVPKILQLYRERGLMGAGGAEGEATAPKKGAAKAKSTRGTSSNDGRSSKRTSKGSTGSRSPARSGG